jgi:endonuclease/exonuclease/phosphatase family metal-dependent hydrolase
MSSFLRLRFVALLAVLLVTVGLSASPASAGKHSKAHAALGNAHVAPKASRELTAMTQNLYLGSSLTPALAAKSPQEFIEAVARIYATVQYTSFPAPLVVSEEVCPVLEGGKFSCGVTLEDRDAILVNEDTPGLTWSNPRSGRYATQQILESPVGPLSFDRGWASIDARLRRQPFRFVDTHLETEDFPAVQQAQAAEFLAGPGKGGTIVATGDFNSAADGSTTTSYAQLTAPGKFRDAWDEGQLGVGWTCCQQSNTPPLAPGALNNSVSTLETRIDLILSRGAARSSGGQAEVVGNAPFQAEPPLWPSDHAGVVAGIRLGG